MKKNQAALTDEQLIEKVAVEVMGWYKEHSHYTLGVWNWEKAGKPVCVATDNRPMMRKQVWNPLADWNHTWEVVAKMAPNWFMMNSRHHDGDWWVSFDIPSREPNSVIDADPRRAICLAALQAISSHP